MSWIKTAVNKAVEVGNKNSITRVVKNYADSVVQQAGQAVAEGAKLLQDRIGNWNQRSFKHAVKRLEEAAVSYRGSERVQLLRRWLVLLKETEKISGDSTEDNVQFLEQHLDSDETKDDTTKPTLVLFYDSDDQSEPMNFREVFLYSQALEGITLSMILSSPTEEEVSLLLEMFRLCLSGGKDVHHAIISSVQDLAKAFSSYQDEVLVKRDELLQFVQGAISGLKVNAELLRVDNQTSSLRKRLDELRTSSMVSREGSDSSAMDPTIATLEALKEALAQVRICSRLEGLLLKKKMLYNGDTPEIHAHKIEKLKVLSESLANSSAKAEKRLSDTRSQREEALKFRGSKESEVSEIEKEIGVEIAGLEKQRDALESELKRVNISLAAARKRLQIAQEEKDQFDEANNQIVELLKSKEEELSRSIGSCKVEADVIKTWMNFLEYTWNLQCTYTEEKEKQAKDELEKHEEFFADLTMKLLSDYNKELEPSIGRIKKFVENLKALSVGSAVASPGDSEESSILNPRRNLEEEYLDYEAKIVTTFSVVDNMKEHMLSEQGNVLRKEDSKVKELFDDIEKLRREFETIERPTLEIESPDWEPETATTEKLQELLSPSSVRAVEDLKAEKGEQVVGDLIAKKGEQVVEDLDLKTEKGEKVERSTANKERVHDDEAELAKLESDFGKSEFGKVGQDYTTDEIDGWDFDELEKELAFNEPEKGK